MEDVGLYSDGPGEPLKMVSESNMVRISGQLHFSVEVEIDLARADGRKSCKKEAWLSKEGSRKTGWLRAE